MIVTFTPDYDLRESNAEVEFRRSRKNGMKSFGIGIAQNTIGIAQNTIGQHLYN